MGVTFELNGKPVAFEGDGTMPLLWYLRDHAGLTGTKYGCGIAACGACTVHVDGRAVRACVMPMRSVAGKAVTTIEAVADGWMALRAWLPSWRRRHPKSCLSWWWKSRMTAKVSIGTSS